LVALALPVAPAPAIVAFMRRCAWTS